MHVIDEGKLCMPLIGPEQWLRTMGPLHRHLSFSLLVATSADPHICLIPSSQFVWDTGLFSF